MFFLCLVTDMPLCASVYMCLVVTFWKRADLLALVLYCLTVNLSLSHWYPGSGVLFDCIVSQSLHSYLLCQKSLRHALCSSILFLTINSVVEMRKCFTFF